MFSDEWPDKRGKLGPVYGIAGGTHGVRSGRIGKKVKSKSKFVKAESKYNDALGTLRPYSSNRVTYFVFDRDNSRDPRW